MTGFVYPVVVAWTWGGGWLNNVVDDPNSEDPDDKLGAIDFAGSGIVHLTGGFAGFLGAYIVGPRKGHFEPIREGGDD